jgi:hypothetical protein
VYEVNEAPTQPHVAWKSKTVGYRRSRVSEKARRFMLETYISYESYNHLQHYSIVHAHDTAETFFAGPLSFRMVVKRLYGVHFTGIIVFGIEICGIFIN